MSSKVQPPEELREKIIEALDIGTCPHFSSFEMYGACPRCLADAALAALFEVCEVREERRIVVDDERARGLPVNGLWITPPVMVGTHRFLSARVERRFVIETKPESVSSTGEERADG